MLLVYSITDKVVDVIFLVYSITDKVVDIKSIIKTV